MLTNRELVLLLHSKLKGDVNYKDIPYKEKREGKSDRTRHITVPTIYSDDERLDASTMIVFEAADGYSSLRSLTFRELLNAMNEIDPK